MCLHPRDAQEVRPSSGRRSFLSGSRRALLVNGRLAEVLMRVQIHHKPLHSNRRGAFGGLINVSVLWKFSWSRGSITASVIVWGEVNTIDLDFTNRTVTWGQLTNDSESRGVEVVVVVGETKVWWMSEDLFRHLFCFTYWIGEDSRIDTLRYKQLKHLCL